MSNRIKKRLGLVVTAGFVLLLALQFLQAPITNPPVSHPLRAPQPVTAIFKKACYDCHSNETRLKWFDKVAPVSWLVSADVKTARSRFNFSTWDTLSHADQQSRLWEMVNMVLDHKMPLGSYAAFHPEANLSQTDITVLKNYLNGLNSTRYHDTAIINETQRQHNHLTKIPEATTRQLVAANGVKYVNGFQNWQVISTTDRFDSHTVRIIYGNDIAVKAVKENHINPWPNGATLVKVVWNSIEEKNGDVEPGSFNNIQIMTKDDTKYPDSKGWGFAKFIGTKLKPYGDSPSFNAACFNCHKAASDYGYVFDVPFPENKQK